LPNRNTALPGRPLDGDSKGFTGAPVVEFLFVDGPKKRRIRRYSLNF
jgi:hypothetical protein